MGNGTSTGQRSDTPYGKRDVKMDSADNSNWPELAGAKLAESSETGRKSYNGAQRGARSRRWSSVRVLQKTCTLSAPMLDSYLSMKSLTMALPMRGRVLQQLELQVLMKKTMAFEQKTIHYE